MATKAGDILIGIAANPKEFNNAIGKMDRDTKGVSKSMQASMTNAWRNIGAVIAGAGAVRAIQSIIDAAGDLELVNLKFRAVFGEAADSVSEWSASVSGDLQSTDTAIKKMVAGLQDLFVPLGFASDKALIMSKSVVQLAHDLAIFNGMKTADVLVNIQSALVGGHESVAKYGVIINEATLSQKLMTMGVDGGTKSANEQQKALARLNLIIGNTTAAHGQSEKALNTYQGALNATKSEISRLSEEIGNGLLPVARDTLLVFRDFLKEIHAFESGGKGVVDVIKEQSSAFKISAQDMELLVKQYADSAEGFNRFWLKLPVASDLVEALGGAWLNFGNTFGAVSDDTINRLDKMADSLRSVKNASVMRGGIFDKDEMGKIAEIAASTSLLPPLPDKKDTDAASKWLVDFRKRSISASDASHQWSWDTGTAIDAVGKAAIEVGKQDTLIREAMRQHQANRLDDITREGEAMNDLAVDGFGALSSAFKDGKLDWESFASSMLQKLPELLTGFDKLRGGSGTLSGGIGQLVSGAGLGDLFGGFFAGGGNPPNDKFFMAGERGPELIYNPGGMNVSTASQTQKMLSGGSGGTNNSITINAPNADGQTIQHLRGLVYTLQSQLAGSSVRQRRFA